MMGREGTVPVSFWQMPHPSVQGQGGVHSGDGATEGVHVGERCV